MSLPVSRPPPSSPYQKNQVTCLNDYRPVALISTIMKFFERLVMRHIKSQLPVTLEPMQFAYRPNRSTDDAITTAAHLALTHLDTKDTYQNAVHRLQLSIQHDYSSAAGKETGSAGFEPHPLQLSPGLPGRKTAGSQDRKQDLQHHHAEHRSSSRLRAQPPAVHTSNP